MNDSHSENGSALITCDCPRQMVYVGFTTTIGGILIILGTIGNSLIIFVRCQSTYRQRASTIYLVGLAACDQCNVFTGLLRHFLASAAGFDITSASPGTCRLIFFAQYFFQYASSWLLAAFNIERACIIASPLTCMTTTRDAVAVTIGIIAFSLFVNLYRVFIYVHTMDDHNCAYCGTDIEHDVFARKIWPWLNLVADLLLPLIAFISSDVVIYLTLRKRNRIMAEYVTCAIRRQTMQAGRREEGRTPVEPTSEPPAGVQDSQNNVNESAESSEQAGRTKISPRSKIIESRNVSAAANSISSQDKSSVDQMRYLEVALRRMTRQLSFEPSSPSSFDMRISSDEEDKTEETEDSEIRAQATYLHSYRANPDFPLFVLLFVVNISYVFLVGPRDLFYLTYFPSLPQGAHACRSDGLNHLYRLLSTWGYGVNALNFYIYFASSTAFRGEVLAALQTAKRHDISR